MRLKQNALNECELKRRKKENTAIKQILLLVGSFMIGYLPRTGKNKC